MPILRPGDESPWVADLQRALRQRGLYDRKIDGGFGSGTEGAVRAFQHSAGLAVTGLADEPTMRALGLEQLIGPVPDAAPESAVLLFSGASFQNVQTNLPFVVAGLVDSGLADKAMFLMALATIRAETAGFVPMDELRSRFNTSPGGHPFDLYDEKRDLGNLGRPDGERYKGRGFIQLTGRANYAAIGRLIGLGDQLVNDPDLANEPSIAGRILAEFLKRAERTIRVALEAKDFALARKAVNGGSHGLDQFRAAYQRGLEIYSDTLRLR